MSEWLNDGVVRENIAKSFGTHPTSDFTTVLTSPTLTLQMFSWMPHQAALPHHGSHDLVDISRRAHPARSNVTHTNLRGNGLYLVRSQAEFTISWNRFLNHAPCTWAFESERRFWSIIGCLCGQPPPVHCINTGSLVAPRLCICAWKLVTRRTRFWGGLGECNEARRVVRRGGAWVVTTGMFWVQTCFERKPNTSPTSRTNFLNHP